MSVTTSALLERRPLTLTIAGLMVAIGLGTTVAYYAASPEALELDDTLVTATVPAGQSVYLGVFALPAGSERSLRVSGIDVHTTSTAELTVVPLLCRGGDIGVTVDPQGYCAEILDPEDQDLVAGDDIVLQVTGGEAAIAVIDRVEVSFRDGFRWGTRPAGSPAQVRILPG